MKTVYLLRHAKSSWDSTEINDFDRPLNERGEKDAPIMGKRLWEKKILPEIIFSSPAIRALSTAKIVASCLNYPENKIHVDRTLYHADEEKLWKYLHHCANEYDSMMIVGHNPGLTEFANELIDESIDNIPTTGIVAVEFPAQAWKGIKEGSGELIFFDFPKNG